MCDTPLQAPRPQGLIPEASLPTPGADSPQLAHSSQVHFLGARTAWVPPKLPGKRQRRGRAWGGVGSGGGNQRPLPLDGAAPCPPFLGHLGLPLHLCPVYTAATTAANPRPSYRVYHAVSGRRVLGKGDNLGPRETASAGTCTSRTLPPPMSPGDQVSSLRHCSFKDTWPGGPSTHK